LQKVTFDALAIHHVPDVRKKMTGPDQSLVTIGLLMRRMPGDVGE
jgi:hypothetical protein